MARFSYQCTCGLQFEAHASMRNNKEPQPCPTCGLKAPRMMPEDVSGTFNQAVTGPVPQNTGISQLDAHIDRVIGQSAKQGWDVAEKRVHEKKEVIQRHPEITGKDLSRNPDGSYRILTPEERGVHDRANAINAAAMTALTKASASK